MYRYIACYCDSSHNNYHIGITTYKDWFRVISSVNLIVLFVVLGGIDD